MWFVLFSHVEASQPEFKLVVAPLQRDLQRDVVSGMEQEPGIPWCCPVLLGLGAAGRVGVPWEPPALAGRDEGTASGGLQV